MIDIDNAVLVVAHPDDEIIWFSSVLDSCKAVIVCFGPSATSSESWDAGRIKLMEAHPLEKVRFLRIRQSGALGGANWRAPKVTPSGLKVKGRVRPSYDSNAEHLRRVLLDELNGATSVITHNPWGEYGHEEHVQVFRVVADLHARLGYQLFVDGYVSNRSMTLMQTDTTCLDDSPLLHQPNRNLAHRLKALYLDHQCWTWLEHYEWPHHEVFYRVRADLVAHDKPTATPPLSYIDHDFIDSAPRKLARKILPNSVRSQLRRLGRRG